MIDPISALTVAGAAFNTVKSFVEQGREWQDVLGQLGKWATAASDLTEWCQQQDDKPSIFKKLSFSDINEEAINAVTVRSRLRQQEKDIREMFQWYGPPGAYEEFIKERRNIQDQRKKTIYNQQRRRQEFVYNVTYLSLITVLIVGLCWLGITVYELYTG